MKKYFRDPTWDLSENPSKEEMCSWMEHMFSYWGIRWFIMGVVVGLLSLWTITQALA